MTALCFGLYPHAGGFILLPPNYFELTDHSSIYYSQNVNLQLSTPGNTHLASGFNKNFFFFVKEITLLQCKLRAPFCHPYI